MSGGTTQSTGDGTTSGNGSTTLTTEDLRPCDVSIPNLPAPRTDGPITERVTGSNVEAASVSISQSAFVCAHDVVVVSASDLDRIAIAARLAFALNGPLLFASASRSSLLAYEIDRLSPKTVWILGEGATVEVPEFSDVETITGTNERIAAEVNDRVDASNQVTLPEEPGIATVVAAVGSFAEGVGVIPSPTTTTTTRPRAPNLRRRPPRPSRPTRHRSRSPPSTPEMALPVRSGWWTPARRNWRSPRRWERRPPEG